MCKSNCKTSHASYVDKDGVGMYIEILQISLSLDLSNESHSLLPKRYFLLVKCHFVPSLEWKQFSFVCPLQYAINVNVLLIMDDKNKCVCYYATKHQLQTITLFKSYCDCDTSEWIVEIIVKGNRRKKSRVSTIKYENID